MSRYHGIRQFPCPAYCRSVGSGEILCSMIVLLRSTEAGRGLPEGLFLKSSLRARVPGAVLDPVNLTLIFGREGVDMDRRECLDTLESVRLRGPPDVEDAERDGMVGVLSEALPVGEGDPGLDSTSSMEEYTEPYDDGPASEDHSVVSYVSCVGENESGGRVGGSSLPLPLPMAGSLRSWSAGTSRILATSP